MQHRRSRALPILLGLAATLGLPAVPAAANGPVTSTPSVADSGWADAPLALPPPSTSARRATVGMAGEARTHEAGSSPVEPHSGFRDRFTDTCEDVAGAGALDVRRVGWEWDGDDRTLDVILTACHDLSDATAGTQVEWFLGPEDGGTFTRRLLLTLDAESSVTMFDTRQTPDPGDDTVVVTLPERDGANPDGILFDSSRAVRWVLRPEHFANATVTDCLGGRETLPCFDWFLRTSSADPDFLPETFEPLATFPRSCDFFDFSAGDAARSTKPASQDRFVVRTAPGQHEAARAAAEGLGLRVGADLPQLAAFSVRDVVGDAEAIRALPGVVDVAPTNAVTRHATPNDLGYDEQWYLPMVEADAAWDLTTGSSDITLAVVDDGIDGTRHDLVGRVAAGSDVSFGSPRTIPPGANSDRGGHGTAVAGVAAGTGDNGGGPEFFDVAGVDWNTTIRPYRVFDYAGCADDEDVARGIFAAVDGGADVINLSLGSASDGRDLRASAEYAETRGVLVVASTGNDGPGGAVNYPAQYDTVIAVGGSTSGQGSGGVERVVDYANTASNVFIVAPAGDGIFVNPARTEILGLGTENDFRYFSGTSFSSPIVAGSLSLLRSLDACLSPSAIRDVLASTAVPIQDTSAVRPDGRRTNSGWGRIDINAMLTADGVGGAPLDAADATIGIAAGAARDFALPISSCTSLDGVDAQLVTSPSNGSVTITGTTARYTPDAGFSGLDEFTYVGRRDTSTTAPATITLSVTDTVRLADDDRYATAAAVSRFTFAPGTDVAYVASGLDFPDALAATAVAGFEEAPVLLTQPTQLPQATILELQRLRPRRIIVVGGTSAVSSPVFNQLLDLAGNGGAFRRSGADRYATAARLVTSVFASAPRIYIATGQSFPDALSGASPAVRDGAPLLLVRGDRVPSDIASAIQALRPTTIHVLGGASVISNTVLGDIQRLVPAASVQRISGSNRYATSVAVAFQRFVDTSAVRTVHVATGANFPDALAGGVAAGLTPAPLLLVPSSGTVPRAVIDEIARLGVQSIVVLGGTSAVPSSILAQLRP